MRKIFLATIALVAGLLLSAPAKAQYTDPSASNPCNQTYQGGFENYQGSGPNGTMVFRFYITVHYQVKDLNVVKATLAKFMITEMNDRAQAKGYNIRFSATDFDSPSNLNFTNYLDIYDGDNDTNDNQYRVYTSIDGWSAGHLFKFYTNIGTSANSLIEAADGTVDRLADGWSCGS